MLVAEKAVGLSWVSVRDRLPFDGHTCALLCRNPQSNELRRAIGCRLHGEWELLARLRIVGVTPHFFNDVFRLNLPLEPTKGILQRLAVLQSNFCQTHHLPTKTKRAHLSLTHLYCAPHRTEYPITRWSPIAHASQTCTNKETLTPSIRRLRPRHHFPFCPRLPLHLLPRLVHLERGHRATTKHQAFSGRGIQIFCSLHNVTSPSH